MHRRSVGVAFCCGRCMFDDMQDLYAFVYSVIAAVDAEISLLVLGVVLLYCVVAIISLKARNAQEASQKEIGLLRAEVDKLAQEIRGLRGQISARATPAVTPGVAQEERVEEARKVERVVPSVPEVLGAPVPSAAPGAPAAMPEPIPVIEKIVPQEAAPSTIAKGMAKSRTSLLGKIKNLFTGRKSVDLATIDDLEEMLITSDVGARVADALVQVVKERAALHQEVTEGELRELLKDGIRKELIPVPSEHRIYQPVGTPLVILVVGVNGVGKTTTVAKLATRYQEQGKKVVAIAADTFRAAAVQQLKEWGNRTGFSVYSGAENAKPAAVVFDGMVAAKEQGADVVLIDTAGRLHTKSNLMQELEGVRNSIRRHVPDAPHETILVVDGVSGQNALSQAREFHASTPLTGLVVTKLDGTPKGGIIVAISQELKVPVFYVGVGEKAHDLLPFSVDEFVDGLLSEEGETNSVVRPPVSSRGDGEAATAV
ncbi:MAG: signal recognition particle GTPase FtsY [Pseudomonadota bacterium]